MIMIEGDDQQRDNLQNTCQITPPSPSSENGVEQIVVKQIDVCHDNEEGEREEDNENCK